MPSVSTSVECRIEHRTVHGFPCVELYNDFLQLELLPDIGGKLISLRDLESGREFLLPPQRSDPPYARAFPGARFESYDTSGFDECFPTIEPCRCMPGTSATGWDLPDHGELWSKSWNWRSDGEEVLCSVGGAQWPYQFERRIRLTGRTVRLSYRVVNLSPAPMPFLWAAHPLLRVKPGDRIMLPGEVREVLLNWSSNDHAGRLGDRRSWPFLDPQQQDTDYSVVPDPRVRRAAKFFSDRLRDGTAALYDPQTKRNLVFHFDARKIPYLGVWLCYGGWPAAEGPGHLTIALEPSSGRPDSLAEAMRRGEHSTVPPDGELTWELELSVSKGMPTFSGGER